jgi:ABC-2 type transport system ATP-binding protein
MTHSTTTSKPVSIPAITLSAITKSYGKKMAVDHIDLSISPGVFYGIVGPNGAGKTTTLSMIAGLLGPTSGNVTVLGNDVWKSREAAMACLGVLMDGLSYPERLTARELFEYSGLLRNISGATLRERVNDLLEVLELDKADKTLLVDFSTGMRKKAALGIALIHAPKVLLLDEPFESIDPISAYAIERVLKQFVAKGGTVVLSSHVMELVERLCSHVAVINEGKILTEGSIMEVAGDVPLYKRFIQLIGLPTNERPMEWL